MEESFPEYLQSGKLWAMSLLSINNISLSRGRRKVLNNLSLSVNPGDRIIVRGENGSGKTSLLQSILGLLPPDSGSILLKDREVGTRPWLRIRSKTAWIPQEGVLHRFPIAADEVVAVGLAGQRFSRKETAERVRNAMESAGASHLEGRCFHRLSGGERQRISLARTLAQGAELLLLDEPAAALDAESRKRLVSLIESLESIAVITVTHEDSLFSTDIWTHKVLEGGRLC